MDADPKDLAGLEKALNDAASKAAVLWTTFITFELYFAISFGSVSHRDLFLGSPIKLPILNVDLPIVGFFIIAPAVLTLFHLYVFLQLYGLAKKAERYDSLLREENAVDADRQYLRQRLDTFFILQLLVGPRDQREGPSGLWLRLIAWMTLVGAPILILLQAQVIFLPYHQASVLWFQRCMILFSLAVTWYYWVRIHRIESYSGPGLLKLGWSVGAYLVTACVALFSYCIATFPGEWIDDALPRLSLVPTTLPFQWSKADDWTSIHKLLFAGDVDEVRSKPFSFFSDRLVVTDQNIIDPEKIEKVATSISLRGRDLRGAVLSRTDLRKADFTGAMLDNAKINNTKLEGAKFACAGELDENSNKWVGDFLTGDQRWPLDGCTWLRMVDFSGSQLQGANLQGARLQGAHLNAANLQGAELSEARLQGSSIDHAVLDGALFVGAKMQGASIDRSSLWGANLSASDLSIASLTESQLQGAGLSNTVLSGAMMNGASVWRTIGEPLRTNEMKWGATSYFSTSEQLTRVPFKQKNFVEWRAQTIKLMAYHQKPDDLMFGDKFSVLDPSKSSIDGVTPISVWRKADRSDSSPSIDLAQSVVCNTEAAYEILKKIASLGSSYTAD